MRSTPDLNFLKFLDMMEEIKKDLPPRPKHAITHVVETSLMTVSGQVRFPNSKKKRIRKKWAKQPRNWGQVPNPKYFVTNQTLFIHPSEARKMRRFLQDLVPGPNLRMPELGFNIVL